MPLRRARDPRVVAALAVHPPDLAATRLRVEQYRGVLAAEGLQLRLWTFLRSSDLADFYGPSHRRRVLVILVALLRLPTLVPVLRGAATVIVQREALPLGPPIVELLAGRGRHLVWDVDDSVWVAYVSPTAGRIPRWLRATGDKFGTICRRADEVWAGSAVLATWCRQRNGNVHVLPTVVDVPPELPPRAPGRTVAWIGSHSTAEFVEGILPELAEVDPPVRVIVVGGAPAVPPGLDCELRPWTPENEAWALREASIGLYPIDPSHPLAEGKCGLKAVLFMAAGVPVLVTPTTTNAEIVRDGVEGLHVEAGQWAAAVGKVLADPSLWEGMRTAAHRRALEGYSVAAWGRFIVDRLDAASVA